MDKKPKTRNTTWSDFRSCRSWRGLIYLIILILITPGTSTADDALAAIGKDEYVDIAFATNRMTSNTNEISEVFGDVQGPLTFGSCTVRFSPIEFLKDAARHIPIRFPTEREDIVELDIMAADEFWADLRHAAETQDSKIVFYIHGYKMDFDKSCRRAALLQRNLGPGITVVLFAWPSQDNFAKYTHDQTRLSRSIDDIESVLNEMLNTIGEGTMHAVGHSMGTHGIVTALTDLEERDQSLFEELVLIAPDMDEVEFQRALPKLENRVSAVTIYASDNDSALKVSREVHGEPRIGEAGEYLTLFEDVETIDISGAPQRDIYGHNYHYFNNRVISDLRQLLIAGTRASARPGLKQKSLDHQPYWEMTALM